jgi:flagellar hook assembly protein FlgD
MHLFDIESKPAWNFSQQARWGNHGPFQNNEYRTPNEENGIHIYYSLGKERVNKVLVGITDGEGKLMQEIEGSGTRGIHKLVWKTLEANPGTYRVTLKEGKNEISKNAVVKDKLLWPAGNRPIQPLE